RPPRTPLCPYTTLFRSELEAVQHEVDLVGVLELLEGRIKVRQAHVAPRAHDVGPHINLHRDTSCSVSRSRRSTGEGLPVTYATEDRKSTRLNSSHVKIS